MKTRIPLAVLACSLLMAASCADPPPRPGRGALVTGPSQDDLLGLPLGSLGLLTCSPLPPDSVTQVVGPSGGVIQVGPHTLTIPAQALAAPVAITAVVVSDTVNVVRFAPEGLTFTQQATLTMSYANCNLLGLLLPKRIAYTNDAYGILEYLLSVDLILSQRVRTGLDHFSGYAVAW